MQSFYMSKKIPRKFIVINIVTLFFWLVNFQNVHSSPKRVISTSPAITEILFALGVGDQVVGVTDYCTYPKKACDLPSIGGPLNPSTETWIALKPDLIILQENSIVINKHAAILKVATLKVSVNNLNNILTSNQVIADSMQVSKTGNNLVNKIKIQIDSYRIRLGKLKSRQVLMLLSDTNDPSRDLYAVGRDTFLNELLSIAGGENVLPDTMARYPKISKEFIISKSPEIIMEIGPKSNMSNKEILNRKKVWGKYSTLRAVKNDRLHFIGADYILIPGPRLVNILDDFTQRIHPELVSIPFGIKQEIKSQ